MTHAAFPTGRPPHPPKELVITGSLWNLRAGVPQGPGTSMQGTSSPSPSFLFLLLAQAPTSPLVSPLWFHFLCLKTSLSQLLHVHYTDHCFRTAASGPHLHVLEVVWNLPPFHCFWDTTLCSPRGEGTWWAPPSGFNSGSKLSLYCRVEAGRSQEFASQLASPKWWVSGSVRDASQDNEVMNDGGRHLLSCSGLSVCVWVYTPTHSAQTPYLVPHPPHTYTHPTYIPLHIHITHTIHIHTSQYTCMPYTHIHVHIDTCTYSSHIHPYTQTSIAHTLVHHRHITHPHTTHTYPHLTTPHTIHIHTNTLPKPHMHIHKRVQSIYLLLCPSIFLMQWVFP